MLSNTSSNDVLRPRGGKVQKVSQSRLSAPKYTLCANVFFCNKGYLGIKKLIFGDLGGNLTNLLSKT